jgi:hypothetical protein
MAIAIAVLPVYSWLSMTPFSDILADALTRMVGTKLAALLLAYVLGPLVAAFVGLTVSLTLGLIVSQARILTGLWMGIVAAVTYLGLAITSSVQPRLVTGLEMVALVGACVLGLGAGRWLARRLDTRKSSPH